jgi:transcriptional regulator with XRE-family HTH domain
LRYGDKYTQDEVAERLGLSRKQVADRQAKERKQFPAAYDLSSLNRGKSSPVRRRAGEDKCPKGARWYGTEPDLTTYVSIRGYCGHIIAYKASDQGKVQNTRWLPGLLCRDGEEKAELELGEHVEHVRSRAEYQLAS